MDGTPERRLLEADSSENFSAGDRAERLAAAITEARQIVEEAGPAFASSRDRLDALRQRLAEERFHLAVLGQFKRGKSTLLNALLGAAVLPTSVVPLTAIPTFVRYGPALSARVVLESGDTGDVFAGGTPEELADFLAKYVTESQNPANRLGVREVEVEYPSSLLRQGVVLIDTPGIGSTYRHNTEATLNFLPQCDAALFIVSPDPPITEVEVEFLKEVLQKTARTFFVFNKVDYLSENEIAESIAFFKQALRDHAEIDGDVEVFRVSARAGLEARLSGDEDAWRRSGMQSVQEYLIDFLANQKSVALQEAIGCKAQAVISDAVLRIGISIESLRIPIEELEDRMRLLQAKLDEVELQRSVQLDVLEGDRKRMIALLEEQAAHLRRKARSRLLEVIHEAAADSVVPDEDAIRRRMADAVPVLFERELGELSRTLEVRVRDTLLQHKRRADELVDSIRRTAAELFNIPYQALEDREGFEVRRRPYWITHQWSYSLSLLPENFWDRFLPASIRRSRAMRRLQAQIEAVVMQNVENVRWPTLQNLEDTFRKFAAQIDEQHREAAVATRDAIETAYQRRKEHAEAVEADVVRLESVHRRLDHVCREIESLSQKEHLERADH